MKFTCTQENLATGLNIVGHLPTKSLNLPILKNVLIKADKDGLELITTNLEVGIRTKVRGKIDAPGNFTVDAKLISDFVNSLKKENIIVFLDGNTLEMEGENHKTKIKGESAADFPLIPDVAAELQTSLPTADLSAALSQVIYSASTDESRPELNAVLLTFDDKKLTLAATDSYRLAEKRLTLKTAVKQPRSIIVPLKTLQQTLRILEAEAADDCQLLVNDNQIKFLAGQTELISRIIEGQYPDYQQIIPDKFKTEISFVVAELVQNIKTTSLFCQPGINDIRLSYLPKTKEVQLRAQNSIAGDNLSKAEAETTGEPGEIVFNYRYLLEGLNNLGSSQATLQLNDSNGPGLLKAAEAKDYLYLIMPIKQ